MFSTSLNRRFGNFIEILVRIEAIFAVIILGIMGLINTIGIFLRVFLGISFIWVNPLTLLLFSWLTFIGAAIIFYHKEYIVVDYFVDHFLSRLKRPLAYIVNFGVIIFLIFIAYEMPGLIKTQTHKMEILPVSTYMLSLPILIGITTILLVFIYRTCDMFYNQNKDIEEV